jgi:hypothetical protein
MSGLQEGSIALPRTIETRRYVEVDGKLLQSNAVIVAEGDVEQPHISSGDGKIGVIWQHNDKDGARIYARVGRPVGSGTVLEMEWLSEPVLLSGAERAAGEAKDGEGWSGSLDIALDNNGVAYAVWAGDGGELRFSRSDDGVEWSPAATVPDSAGHGVRLPRFAVLDRGGVRLVGTGTDRGADVWLRVSDDQGANWSAARTLVRTPGFTDAPAIAVHGGQVVGVADDRSANLTSSDVLFLSDEGSQIIARDGAFADIASDGRHLFVSFVDQQDYSLAYMASADGGRTWTRDDVPLSTPVALRTPLPSGLNISDPAIATFYNEITNEVRVYVIWIQFGRDETVAKVAWRTAP